MGGSLYGLGRLPRAEYLALERRLRAYLDEFGDVAARDVVRVGRTGILDVEQGERKTHFGRV